MSPDQREDATAFSLGTTPSDTDDGAAPAGPSDPPRNIDSRLTRQGRKWTRLLHVYVSMVALLLMLFFGVTGITANHPEWTLGFDPTTSVETDSLPDGVIDDAGGVDYLALSEYLRSEEGVTGTVTDYGLVGDAGYMSYRGPGYSADVTFDVAGGTFELRIEEQGLMAIINDLHKGRNTAEAWNWTIDVAGALLVAIAVTGLVLQLFLRKRRTASIIVALVGGGVALVLTWLALT